MKYFFLLTLVLIVSCSSLKNISADTPKSLQTFENKNIKFNYSKDWLVYANDSIRDEIILAPLAGIRRNDLNEITSLFAKFIISCKTDMAISEFKEKGNSKKRTVKFSKGNQSQINNSRIKRINDFHYIEKVKINLTIQKTDFVKNYTFYHTIHHIFHNNNVYVLLFENDYKKTPKYSRQAKIIFDTFEIK